MGGYAFPSREDSEAETLINFDFLRDGRLATRLGCTKLNTNSMGSTIMVGIGYAYLPTERIIVAKYGNTMYHKAQPYDGAWAAITSPQNTGDNDVRMENAVDTTSTPLVLFASNGYTGILEWDGVAAGPTLIAGSPVGRFIRSVDGVVYVAGNITYPFRIYFSDESDPETWPTDNFFDIESRHGKITGLERQAGFMVIFTEKSILQLQGNPPLNFRVRVLHEGMGCTAANSISTFGSVTAFVSNGGVFFYLSGGVSSFGEQIVGAGFHSPNVGSGADNYGVLTPYTYFYNTTQCSSGSAAAPSASGARMYVYDRLRFRSWVIWEYPVTTAYGSLSPSRVPALSNEDGLIVGGGDGNIYLQKIRTPENASGQAPISFTQDSTAIDVVSTYESRDLVMGDFMLQKGISKVIVSEFGSSMTVKLKLRNYAYTLTPYTLVNGAGSLPAEYNLPATADRFGQWAACRLYVSGKSIIYRGADIFWRPIRYSGNQSI